MLKQLTRAAALALAALALTTGPAEAQPADTFPSKTIKFVVHTTPGGPLDTMVRMAATLLNKQLGWSTVVENRPGASGAVGMSYVMTQAADGYTILSATSSTTFSMAKGQIPFKVSDLYWLQAVQAEPTSVAVLKDSKLKSVKDFVEYLKKNPKGLKVGGFESGGFHQFTFYQLQRQTGFQANWVPFRSGKDAAVALLGGHIDVCFMTPSSALAQVENGDIRLLGMSTQERSPFFPEVPTLKEQGYDVVEALWRGFVMKAGAPGPVIEKLQAGLEKIQESAEWKEYMKKEGQVRVNIRDYRLRKLAEKEVEERRAFLEQGGFLTTGK